MNRLEKSEFYPTYCKTEGILASFYFYFFSDFLIEVYLLNRVLYLLNSLNEKILENGKNTGKVSLKIGDHGVVQSTLLDLNRKCTKNLFELHGDSNFQVFKSYLQQTIDNNSTIQICTFTIRWASFNSASKHAEEFGPIKGHLT